jgi:hypothetical protein
MSWLNNLEIAMTEASTAKNPAEQEFEATRAVYNALEPLDDDARERVVKHVAGMLEISAAIEPVEAATGSNGKDEEDAVVETPADAPIAFKTFAELFDAADPQTAADKALIAGYWLQVCEGGESFDGQRANKELTHLGHKIGNITNALTALNGLKPSLAIQLKKSGNTRQARKTYKITVAGVEAVKAMLNG